MSRRFRIEQLDQVRLIKENDLKEITNPAMFNSTNGPTPDGLLSNEIFGITKAERSGIPAFIDLKSKFIQPYFYKIWLKMFTGLRSCVYETEYFKIKADGTLEKDPNGETGIDFIVKNIDKIKFANSKRDGLIKALKIAKDNNLLFTDKFVITPPFYRDVNTNGGKIGVGEINKLYINLLNSIKSLESSTDYGLNMNGGIKGRIQDIMLEIYNWHTVGESVIGGEHTGAGIFKKTGMMRQSVMSKTVDNSVRLVLTAQDVDVETKEDLMVDLDHSSIPLSSALATYHPFIIYELRQFLNNEFGGKTSYPYMNSKREVEDLEFAEDPQLLFSDDRLDKEINEFIHGYSNRFKPITIPLLDKNGKKKDVKLFFKGYKITKEEYSKGVRETGSFERVLLWLDLFFIAANNVIKDKYASITRYPIDSYFNKLYTGIRISSTVKTEPMVFNGNFYQWYPSVTEADINTDTSNKFIDSLSICNVYCPAMNADFDGDQCTTQGIFSIEANEEVKNHINSNAQYIDISGTCSRVADKEAIQAMYNLTLVLPETKLTNPQF